MGADAEAQRAARDAVMEIPLFPDLIVRLRDALGYGPHCEMLQHYCYWMNPEKRKMRNRWSIWKTFDEWYEECGLTDRQVKKGRKKLRELGIMSHKRGQYSRVYYQVDWVALADALDLSYVVDEDDIWFDDEDEFIPNGNSVPNGNENRSSFRTAMASDFIPDGNSVQFIPDGYGVRLNTREYARDYLQEKTLLQRAPEPAFAEPAAMDRNGKEDKDGLSSLPIEHKRHSKDGDTASADIAVREVVEEVQAPPKPNDDALLDEVTDILNPDSGRWYLAAHVSAKHSAKTVADCILSEDGMSELVRSVPYEDLLAAITYVRWDAEEELS